MELPEAVCAARPAELAQFTRDETATAVRRLSAGKAPDEVELTAEMMTWAGAGSSDAALNTNMTRMLEMLAEGLIAYCGGDGACLKGSAARRYCAQEGGGYGAERPPFHQRAWVPAETFSTRTGGPAAENRRRMVCAERGAWCKACFRTLPAWVVPRQKRLGGGTLPSNTRGKSYRAQKQLWMIAADVWKCHDRAAWRGAAVALLEIGAPPELVHVVFREFDADTAFTLGDGKILKEFVVNGASPRVAPLQAW